MRGIINYIQDLLSKSYSMNSPGPGDYRVQDQEQRGLRLISRHQLELK